MGLNDTRVSTMSLQTLCMMVELPFRALNMYNGVELQRLVCVNEGGGVKSQALSLQVESKSLHVLRFT